MEKFAQRVIDWSFYLLFFLVPLVFFSGSFELFEYNKMMLTYSLTVIIGVAWFAKIIASGVPLQKPWRCIPRTPFDIPIALYLLSHIISTLFSIDPHVSIWGYYSRFHEGLLATFSYVFLFYAAVGNLQKATVLKLFTASFASAVIVSLWGTAEHLGGSPSCLFITKQLNNNCWIQDVTNRVFATLGQPNWMAAYLDIILLILLSIIATIKGDKPYLRHWQYYALLALCFAALLFTKSRSGLVGLALGVGVFGSGLLFLNRTALKSALLPFFPVAVTLLLLAFVVGIPVPYLEKVSLPALIGSRTSVAAPADTTTPDFFISESGDIRKIVWEGAIQVWQRYPLFGSGVETFAYSYYLDRPVEHNMVSEWDFLYNKAHNEFLNILATTGTVGMLAYLSMILVYSLWVLRIVWKQSSDKSSTPESAQRTLIVLGLFAAYVSLLITNFFGFSVVIIGLFFFLIPAFSFCFVRSTQQENGGLAQSHGVHLTAGRLLAIGAVAILGMTMESNLFSMWSADRNFAYGRNLDGINEFVSGYPYLLSAVQTNGDEPTFRDELSYNEAVLATLIYKTVKGATESGGITMDTVLPSIGMSGNKLIEASIADSNSVVEQSPNSMPFWKTRTKTFYQLGTIDGKYLLEALTAIKEAAKLAPTDAKVHYNVALIHSQLDQIPDAIRVFEQTIAMKPDYREARFQLALNYELVDQRGKARAQMEEIVKRDSKDTEAIKWLEEHPL